MIHLKCDADCHNGNIVGVEKTLKLLQSTSQIAANIGYWSVNEAAQWTVAKNQFALGKELEPFNGSRCPPLFRHEPSNAERLTRPISP